MSRRSIFTLAAVLLITGPRAHSEDRIARVELVFLTSFGEPVLGKISVAITGTGAAKRVDVPAREFVDLPYGVYTIEAVASSFVKRARIVEVAVPRMQVVFGLALKDPGQLIGEGTPARWVVSGRIGAKPESRAILVRLVGVVSDVSKEAEVDSAGAFSIETTEQGRYFLLAIDRGRVFAQKEIVVDLGQPRSIDVGTLGSLATSGQ